MRAHAHATRPMPSRSRRRAQEEHRRLVAEQQARNLQIAENHSQTMNATALDKLNSDTVRVASMDFAVRGRCEDTAQAKHLYDLLGKMFVATVAAATMCYVAHCFAPNR